MSIVFVSLLVVSSWLIVFVESIVFVCVFAVGFWVVVFDQLDLADSSNVVCSVVLVIYDSSNVLVVLDSLVVYVMYVSMYEGRANYQYYALQGSE